MRVKVLLRHPAFVAYTVECRRHERSVWIDESSPAAEFVYPLAGGFVLDVDGGSCACLPARLTVLPAGARYRIRHLPGLPDSTLVVRIAGAPTRTLPDRAAHMFLGPAEAAGLQLLAATLCAGGSAPALIGGMLGRARAAAIPHARLATRPMPLERSLELLLGRDASVAECAHAVGCSEYHFRHGFRDCYGTTPHTVRRTLRLARALRHLLQGGRVTTAARVCGFAHASHLSGEMRRLTGRSPTALLRAHRACGAQEAERLWGYA